MFLTLSGDKFEAHEMNLNKCIGRSSKENEGLNPLRYIP